VTDLFLNRVQRGDTGNGKGGSVLSGLTPRELQVMRMVAEWSVQAIVRSPRHPKEPAQK
jgi:hypothetical protein